MQKSKFTKLLCLVLSLMMILGAVPITASAETTTPDYFYVRNLSSNECLIRWGMWGSPVDSIWYSFDKGKTTAWELAADPSITSSPYLTLGASGTSTDTLYFKGLRSPNATSGNYFRLQAFDINKKVLSSNSTISAAGLEAGLEVGGDMTTLLNCSSAGSTVCGNLLDLSSDNKYAYALQNKFDTLMALKKIDNLKLPSTTLAANCYTGMFISCENLESIPEDLLPATKLAANCYYDMFGYCTALTTVPEKLLPATTLAEHCYERMFASCTALTTVPEKLLPATTLAPYCYQQMFYAYSGMTLEKAPDLPAKDLVTNCYNQMFNGCNNLSSLRVNFSAWKTDGTTKQFIPTSLNPGVTLTFCCPAGLKTTDNTNNSMVDAVKNQTTFKSVYTANVSTQNGTAALDRLLYTNDETVTVTVQPIEKYQVDSITVNGSAAGVTKTEKNVYTFTMPSANATVDVKCVPHTHNFAAEWTTDAYAHWHVCTTEECPITSYADCGIEGAAYGAHTLVDGACSVCGRVFVEFTAQDNVLTATTKEEPSETYTLTLTENGTISAEEVAAWQAAGLVIPEIVYNANTVSITVKDQTATVTLADNVLTAHSVKVICGADGNGKSYLTDVMPGTAITVTAGSYEGKEFEKWIAPLGINGSTEETVTFTMPNEDITVEAEFVDCYPLSIFDGTTLTSTPQKVNYSATVTAPATPEGMRFIGWTAEGITLTDPTASTLSFTMPGNAVMLTSNYATLYAVTVEGGKITGADTTCQAIAGETISITADTVSGHNFTGWTGEGVIFDDATKTTTTFTMPEGDVTVKANHEQIKVTAPTAGTETYTYNGEPQTYAFASEGDVSYYELTGDSITQTNAGTYTIKAHLTVEGTAWADDTTEDKEYTFVIARQPVEKPIAYNIGYTYDGNLKTFILCTQIGSAYYYYQSFVSADKVTITNDTRTDAGTQTVTATPTANYCWEGGATEPLSFTFTVKRYAIPVLFDDPRDFTYDGTEQTYTPFVYMDGSIYDFNGLFYDLANNKQTAAGNYTVTATLKNNFCWADGSTEPRNMTFEIKEKKINSYIYHIKEVKTGDLTTYVDIAYTIYDNINQLKGFEKHEKHQPEMLKDRYIPNLVNAPEGATVNYFITKNPNAVADYDLSDVMNWDSVKMADLEPGATYYAYAVVSHPDYEYGQMTDITECSRFITTKPEYTLITKHTVTTELINEAYAFDVISSIVEGGINGIISSFFTQSEEEEEIVKIKVERFSDIDAAVLQGIKDVDEEGLQYAAISFNMDGHSYFFDMASGNVNMYKNALGIKSAVYPAAKRAFALSGVQPSDEITGITDEPKELTSALLEAMSPGLSFAPLDNIEFKIAMAIDPDFTQLNAKNTDMCETLKSNGAVQNEGTPENYFSKVKISSVLYDPETDCVKGESSEYDLSAGEKLPKDAVKNIEGYTLDGLYFNDIIDYELKNKSAEATGDHGRILTQGLTKWESETDFVTRDVELWAIYVKDGAKEPVSYKVDGTIFSDAGSKVTVALPAIFESMSYGDVINDNADIAVSAVADGKVTVTANKDLTGGDPLTFKVNVNANKEGVEDPFYYIIVTINAVAAEPVKLEAQTVIEALANDTASAEVKAIISNAVAALASADSIEAVNEIIAAAEKAVAEQKAAENTPDEPEEDGKYAACKDRVSGFCNVYNKYLEVPVLNFIFNCIHALVHIIAEIF